MCFFEQTLLETLLLVRFLLYNFQFIKEVFSLSRNLFIKFVDLLLLLFQRNLQLPLQALVLFVLKLELIVHKFVSADSLVELLNLLLLNHNGRYGSILNLLNIRHQILVLVGQSNEVALSGRVSSIGQSSIQLKYLLSALNQLIFLPVQFLQQMLALRVLGLQHGIAIFILVSFCANLLVVEVVFQLDRERLTSMILVLSLRFSSYDLLSIYAKSACVAMACRFTTNLYYTHTFPITPKKKN